MMRPTQGPIFLCRGPIGFRLAINGLSLLVEQHLAMSPFDTALYVFSNRHTNRLEKDRFHWPAPGLDKAIVLSTEELNWLLDGFETALCISHGQQAKLPSMIGEDAVTLTGCRSSFSATCQVPAPPIAPIYNAGHNPPDTGSVTPVT